MEDGDIRQLLALGAAHGNVRTVGDGNLAAAIPFTVLADGFKLQSLEELLPSPLAHRGKASAQDAESFLILWSRFSREGSAIFVDVDSPTYVAVFDYASRGEPSWNRHTVVFEPAPSLEWAEWTAANGRKMNQVAFAEFIEDNLNDILSPSPAEMLEISTHLTAHRQVQFESATRLQNGQTQFRYDETVRGTVKAGAVEIPERFTVGLSPFFRGEAFKLEARLRYRIEDGRLVMWYDLYRHQEFFHKAVDDLTRRIADATKVAVIHGAP